MPWGKRPRFGVVERIMARVDKDGSPHPVLGNCWLWLGARDHAGYGYIGNPGGSRLVHRIIYEALHGPIGEGLTVDHLCLQKSCVKPGHMELVTLAVNGQRGSERGRPPVPRGSHVKTHCIRGHPLSGDNLVVVSPHRAAICRMCRDERHRAWYTAHRDEECARMRRRYSERKEQEP